MKKISLDYYNATVKKDIKYNTKFIVLRCGYVENKTYIQSIYGYISKKYK